MNTVKHASSRYESIHPEPQRSKRRSSNGNDALEIETNTPDVGYLQASTIRLSPILGSRVSSDTIQENDGMNNSEIGMEKYAALIGMDWAAEKHDLWMGETATGESQHQVIEPTPEALAEWLAELQARYPGRRVAVCLEQSRGALIYALMGQAFLDLYPINPVTLSRYRQAFSPSRAKDDPSDAKLLSEILRLHRDKLTAWKPQDEQTRTLTLLNEERRKAVDLRTKLVLRLQSALKLYFPQAIEWVGVHLYDPLACDFLLKWPTLEALQKANPQTIRAFYYAHNCRRPDHVEENLQAMGQGPAADEGSGSHHGRCHDGSDADPAVTDLAWFHRAVRSRDCQVVREASRGVPLQGSCGCWTRPGATAGQCLWNGSAATSFGPRHADLQWNCAGDRTPWKTGLDALALELSEVSAADVSRVCEELHSTIGRGQGVLRIAEAARERT